MAEQVQERYQSLKRQLAGIVRSFLNLVLMFGYMLLILALCIELLVLAILIRFVTVNNKCYVKLYVTQAPRRSLEGREYSGLKQQVRLSTHRIISIAFNYIGYLIYFIRPKLLISIYVLLGNLLVC